MTREELKSAAVSMLEKAYCPYYFPFMYRRPALLLQDHQAR